MFDMFRARLIIVLLLFAAPGAYATTPADSLAFVGKSADYVEIMNSDAIALDLRYATTNNFTSQNLYGVYNRAFLHKLAAGKLNKAAVNLRAAHPGYKLVIFDALRPRSVQYLLWKHVKGTDQQKYVANPKSGSIHNFGFALDLSIIDDTGKELDMGTPFDAFFPLAQPRLEVKFLESGKLTKQQLDNRLLLRKVMEDAGFIQLPLEWWHYDALPRDEVMRSYSIVE
jgi:D-alanyl-D-alanine dipeptidase